MRSTVHPGIAGAVLLIGGTLVAGWYLRSAEPASPCVVAGGPAMLPDLPESSGLAISRRSPGVLWSHNDSSHAAVLFALDSSGVVRGRLALPIRTRDWEDISTGESPFATSSTCPAKAARGPAPAGCCA